MACFFISIKYGVKQLVKKIHKKMMADPPAQGSTEICLNIREDGTESRDSGICSIGDENSRPAPDSHFENCTRTMSPSQEVLFSAMNNSDDVCNVFREDEKEAMSSLDVKIRESKAKSGLRLPLSDRTNLISPDRKGSFGDVADDTPYSKRCLNMDETLSPSCLDGVATPPTGCNQALETFVFDLESVQSPPSGRLFWGNEKTVKPLRRTFSGVDESTTSRKRNSAGSAPSSARKRSRAIHIPTAGFDDTLESFDDDVFSDSGALFSSPASSRYSNSIEEREGVLSPTSSIISSGEVRTPQSQGRNLNRALSTGALECGEYSKNSDSPNLPKPMHVEYSLSVIKNPEVASQAFKSICGATLQSEFEVLGEEGFRSKYLLIDCRYDYEYNGGHIKTAINMFDHALISSVFFPDDQEEFEVVRKKIPIFYCEYSQKRGPGMAHAVRRLDRLKNEYPSVFFSEMYLLEKGYKKFFLEDQIKSLCEPCSYVPMDTPAHQHILRQHKWHRSKSANILSKEKERERADSASAANAGQPAPAPTPTRPVSLSQLSPSNKWTSPSVAGVRPSFKPFARRPPPRIRLTFESDDSF